MPTDRNSRSAVVPDSRDDASRRAADAPSAENAPEERKWIENRPSSRWLPRLDLGELWSYRELAWALAQRDLTLRYRQTALGVAWALIQPLAAVAIFTVVFGHLTEVPHEGIPYPVFVYAGLTIWTFFSGAITRAAEILVEHRDMITRVYFPRILAPLAAALPPLVDLALSIVVVVGFMAVFSVSPGPALLLLPAWIVAVLLLAFGVGLSLSALNVRYRDVRHALPFVIQLWLFASPVIYPSSLFQGGWRYVYALNPMVGAIDGFRWSLIDASPPPPADLISALVGLVLLAMGIVYFHRVERRFADLI